MKVTLVPNPPYEGPYKRLVEQKKIHGPGHPYIRAGNDYPKNIYYVNKKGKRTFKRVYDIREEMAFNTELAATGLKKEELIKPDPLEIELQQVTRAKQEADHLLMQEKIENDNLKKEIEKLKAKQMKDDNFEDKIDVPKNTPATKEKK